MLTLGEGWTIEWKQEKGERQSVGKEERVTMTVSRSQLGGITRHCVVSPRRGHEERLGEQDQGVKARLSLFTSSSRSPFILQPLLHRLLPFLQKLFLWPIPCSPSTNLSFLPCVSLLLNLLLPLLPSFSLSLSSCPLLNSRLSSLSPTPLRSLPHCLVERTTDLTTALAHGPSLTRVLCGYRAEGGPELETERSEKSLRTESTEWNKSSSSRVIHQSSTEIVSEWELKQRRKIFQCYTLGIYPAKLPIGRLVFLIMNLVLESLAGTAKVIKSHLKPNHAANA